MKFKQMMHKESWDFEDCKLLILNSVTIAGSHHWEFVVTAARIGVCQWRVGMKFERKSTQAYWGNTLVTQTLIFQAKKDEQNWEPDDTANARSTMNVPVQILNLVNFFVRERSQIHEIGSLQEVA